MKLQLQNLKTIILFVGLICFNQNIFSQSSEVIDSNKNFIVPAGITSVTVEAWGGGAGTSTNNNASGGGGGGAYTKGTFTVAPGDYIFVYIGPGGGNNSDGQNTTFGSYLTARGGKAGDDNGGAGGAASALTGGITASYAGGKGGNPRNPQSGNNNEAGGGGGGSGLTTATGGNGSNGGSSDTTPTPGGSGTGDGGVGATADGSQGSSDGIIPGGGGGGRGEGGGGSGKGARGRVIVYWGNPEIDILGGSPLVSIPDGDSTPVTTDNTSFGSTNVASGNITKTFTIKNTGTSPLTLGAISFSGAAAADYSATALPATLASGGSTTFTVTFDPSAFGTRTAIISIVNNDSNENPYTFTIEGTGNGPEINLKGGSPLADINNGDNNPDTADNTDFGSVDIASGTVVKTFTIQNIGNQALTTNTVTISGAGASSYSITSQPATSVAANGTTTFTVTFDPATIGTKTAIISIPNNDSDENPYTFTITGLGITVAPEINIQGNSISIGSGSTATSTTNNTNFGSQDISAGQATRTFTIQNTGNASLTIGSISFSGSADFTVIAQPNTAVSGSGSTTFTVAFDPTTTGTKTAIISIINNDSDENPYTFTITGQGVSAPEIDIQGNTISIPDGDNTPITNDNTDFGQQNIDGGITTRTFVIKNLGSVALTIGTITFGGTNASEFSIGTAPSASIAAGGSSTFTVRFDPGAIGVRNATISIVNNDSDENPYNFSISGTGSMYNDSDGDGVTDESDIDDDNDGVIDTQEQSSCIISPEASSVYSPFLNESFGTGTGYSQINTTYTSATTNYTYVSSGDVNDGSYTVKNSAQITSWAAQYWWTGGDHTGNSNGKMAIFNASFDPGIFYTTTITGLTPNIPIRYSFWALNLDRSNAPGIATRIRPNVRVEFYSTSTNQLLTFLETGALPPNTSTANWKNFISEFTTSETSIKVVFINHANGGTGNDIALDDITINQKYCDLDSDGQADIFDLDDDNDGIPDIVEVNMRSLSSNKSRMDMETVGKWVDNNHNGLHDLVDGYILGGVYLVNYVVDTDGDGMNDFMDIDSDNDSIFDIDEADKDNFATKYNGDGDIDGDGRGDGGDTDRDGIKDLNDDLNGYGTTFKEYPVDSDNDGIPDYLDTTSNGTTKDIAGTIYADLDTNLDGRIDGTDDQDRDGVLDVLDGDKDALGSPRNITTKKLFINFDGRNDYAEGSQLLSGLSNATIMGWIRLDNAYTNNGIAFGQDKFNISVNASKQLVVTANSQTITYTTTPLTTTRWYHVAATFKGGASPKINLYLNGVLVNSVTASANSLASSTTKFTIAKNAASATSFFRGFIDEVRVFNIALTDTQLQRMIYQEIDSNSGKVKGVIIPLDIDGTNVPWTSLLGYYRLDNYKNDVIDDYKTNTVIDEGTATTLARIYNVKYLKFQTAPMPFITSTTGALEASVNNPANYIYGPDINTYPHSIVEVKHDVTSSANFSNIGLLVDEGKTLTVNNNTGLTNTWYLGLDGKIDLEGKSQLVQTLESELKSTTTGSIERDQQGTTNKYNYNYWSSPVSSITDSNVNNGYTVDSVMKDGTSSSYQNLSWTSSLDGSPSPLTLSSYWIFKFQNLSEQYANWQYVGPNGSIGAGQGYTLKGDGAGTGTQNYTFVGKPNNGTITSPIAASNINLSGNPYPSALDSEQFIKDNISGGSANPGSTNSIDGSLYFWEHAPANNTHVLASYQGGYAVRNLIGGIPPVAAAGTAGTGNSSKTPGRYIPVGQAFFVQANTSGGQIRFKNTQRAFVKETDVVSGTPQSNPIFRPAATVAASNSDNPQESETESFVRIRLGFNTHDNQHRQILLGFTDGSATDGLDYGYDSENFDDNPSDMYFRSNNTNLSIQGVGSFSDTAILPLGVKSDATGNIQIVLDKTENLDPDQDIYIYDAVTAQYHDIKNGIFETTLDAGTFNDRFSLRFTNSVLGIDNPELNEGITIAYTQDNALLTIVNNMTDKTVESASLFNMLGQQIAFWITKDKTQEKIEIPVTNTSTGTYIVKVKTTTGTVAKKIVIR